ncbi:hypothetical protein BJX70DRAFT_336404 [Aspergillus crustosus]
MANAVELNAMAIHPNSSSPAPQDIRIFEETDANTWEELPNATPDVLKQKEDRNLIVFLSEEFKKKNEDYKNNFQEEFWPVFSADINGSFHCEYGVTGETAKPTVSWSCFKVKQVKAAKDYTWKQPTIHVEWNPTTRRQLVHVFELGQTPQVDVDYTQQDEFIKRVPKPEERACNPFSWHATFARIILDQYDGAFWLLRHLVRAQEKDRSQHQKEQDEKEKKRKHIHKHIHKRKQKENDFHLLHDILRHLFHYQETIEVAEHTLQALSKEFVRWRADDDDDIKKNMNTFVKTRQLILYEEKRAHSLKTRSKSLNDRHQNEINLAFNLVNQGFGHDARSDSNMMKTVAVVSMVYLPGTFVSGMFGTNFFSFQADPGNTWLTADEFWIYWAVTIPLTLATMAVWAIWHFRDHYSVWWAKAFEGKKKKEPEVPKDVDDGVIPISRRPSTLQTVTSWLRLREVQRQETV